MFETIINRNTRIGEAPSFGKPVIMYDADSTGARDYMNLAREILQLSDRTEIPDSEKILDLENE